jgi:hypothetical protein
MQLSGQLSEHLDELQRISACISDVIGVILKVK